MGDEFGGDPGRELIRMWRCYKTARQMCADRGYQLAESELDISLDDFRRDFADANGYPDRRRMNFSARPTDEMIAKYSDPPTASRPNQPPPAIGTVWVEFNGEPNVGIKQLRQFIHYISTNNFHTGIFVTKAAITSSALKVIPTIAPLQVETFLEQDLLINITHHELVPKHVLLSKEEKAQLLDRYRLKESQLPRIQEKDPVARYLGLRRGQVVKIIRKSETAGRYASYRWVVSA
ncbi:RNA polymerase [Lineolata rhizophorae]|uniref:DNA-directed RNA polymerases I, II, and III subunit RPABC1 n=1 Tax=Lineolata rhizophorae TaxID=578093 RepID=A0A6A6NUE0_9PEZI|nr:RNA polymerase [Lineolata rhizophorae]